MPVTKDHDRHYAAISAEVEAIQKAPWTCLVCQTVNAGPLAEGCSACGSATQVARKAPVEVPKPRNVNVAAAGVLRGVTHMAPDQAALAAAARFLQQSPQAGVIDAYLAGYLQASRDVLEGMRDGLKPFQEALVPHEYKPTPQPSQRVPTPTPSPPEVGGLSPEGKPTRTILAALALFRDQVLVEGPEEVATGEWCGVEEVNGLITRLTEEQHGYRDPDGPDYDSTRTDLDI